MFGELAGIDRCCSTASWTLCWRRWCWPPRSWRRGGRSGRCWWGTPTAAPRRWPTRVQHTLTTRRLNFAITEEAPTRAFSWLKAPTSAFTFRQDTMLHKQTLTSTVSRREIESLMQLSNGRAAIRHYAVQPAHPLWPLRRGPYFMSTYCGLWGQRS